jgi:hypothetical protein
MVHRPWTFNYIFPIIPLYIICPAKKVTTMANTQRSQPDDAVCTNIFDPVKAPNKTPITTGIDKPGLIYPRCK